MVLAALITRFLAREIETLYLAGDGRVSAGLPPRIEGRRLVCFPGSFNPLHSGHLRLAAAASELTYQKTGQVADLVFEMSVSNADKGDMSDAAARERLEQFSRQGATVVLTRTPLYIDKARLLAPCDFVVGADTATRILDPKYYGDLGVEASLDVIRDLNCGFIVAGRYDLKAQAFVNVDNALSNAPSTHRDLFATLSDFRCDISSTEIRANLIKDRLQSSTVTASLSTLPHSHDEDAVADRESKS